MRKIKSKDVVYLILLLKVGRIMNDRFSFTSSYIQKYFPFAHLYQDKANLLILPIFT
jgi:hypothetical protein